MRERTTEKERVNDKNERENDREGASERQE